MSDAEVRFLERTRHDSPEAQRAYLNALTRHQGFYPPAVIHQIPTVVDLSIKTICGHEFSGVMLASYLYVADYLETRVEQMANENFISTATPHSAVRALVRQVGMVRVTS